MSTATQNAELVKKEFKHVVSTKWMISRLYQWLQLVGWEWFRIKPQYSLSQRPGGLRNFGNTCYLNSILQVHYQSQFL